MGNIDDDDDAEAKISKVIQNRSLNILAFYCTIFNEWNIPGIGVFLLLQMLDWAPHFHSKTFNRSNVFSFP